MAARRSDANRGFTTYPSAPVAAREKLLGVLKAINKKDGRLFGQENLQDFVSLGHQVGAVTAGAWLR